MLDGSSRGLLKTLAAVTEVVEIHAGYHAPTRTHTMLVSSQF